MMPDLRTFLQAAALVGAGWCAMYGIIWLANALGLLN